MEKRLVTILCSGFGLGFYIPGLIVDFQLNKQGVVADVDVFENYLINEKKEKINESKKAYHENFSVALISQKMPFDIRDSIDWAKVESLIATWKKEKRRDFITLSGHWVYILDAYRSMVPDLDIKVDLLYVDSDLSPSWKGLKKHHPTYNSFYNDIWLYDSKENKINFRIVVGEDSPIPYRQRNERFLIHGGGWGMGTYQGKIPELQEKGFLLDIVAYDFKETINRKEGNRYFLNDPSWSATNRNKEGQFEFPMFGEVKGTETTAFSNRKDYHKLYDVSREAKGIISKPGAGTLMDSLSSATPLIILEPFGKHEQKNSDLWIYHGFGILYDNWKETGFSLEVLEDIHANILKKRAGYKDYVNDFVYEHGIGKNI